ncbi:MAG: tRNA (adenosine(37)-N6)-threonylcarbamoyltransferase complex dimerization subunit type 1 TsaB [Clostridiales bacterium]|nr:tRNA (adenosine(37)-N6)-threonylcarbamoyltransferase complex dimerization subunit type 1 TsaB [Clostridiales bacterium]
MNYLVIDTSSKHLIILLSKNDEVFTTYLEDCQQDHSTRLMVEVDKILSDNGVTLFDMDFFGVVVGPGSFTGIRIGVATVKAFSLAVNKPVLPITSFDTITYNKGIGSFLAIIDAKHDNFYAEGVKDGKITLEPCFINKTTLEELKKEYSLITIDDILGVEKVSVVDGLKIAVMKNKEKATFNLDLVTPLYVRKSQAEENR